MHDLDVTMDAPLDFLAAVCRKGLAGLSVLFQCFVSRDLDALLRAYVASVRPLLEYASVVWDPALKSQFLAHSSFP